MSIACYKTYSVDVVGCDSSTDWLSAPGTCRLRIKNYNAADWAASTLCFQARAGVVAPWDGTFSETLFVVSPQPGFNFLADTTTFQTAGGVYLGSAGTTFIWYNAAITRWRFSFSYQTIGLADGGRWTGDLISTSPLGVYSVGSKCTAGLPDTVEIEGYPL